MRVRKAEPSCTRRESRQVQEADSLQSGRSYRLRARRRDRRPDCGRARNALTADPAAVRCSAPDRESWAPAPPCPASGLQPALTSAPQVRFRLAPWSAVVLMALARTVAAGSVRRLRHKASPPAAVPLPDRPRQVDRQGRAGAPRQVPAGCPRVRPAGAARHRRAVPGETGHERQPRLARVEQAQGSSRAPLPASRESRYVRTRSARALRRLCVEPDTRSPNEAACRVPVPRRRCRTAP